MGRNKSLPPGSLCKLLRRASFTRGAESRSKKKYNLAACRMETAITKELHKMRCQNNMSQTKEQDKTPEQQLSKVEIGKLPKKSFQSNNSKDDPRSQKKNGGTH